jgi:N-acetylglucosamine-6-phosphate deacetylase
VWTGRRWLDRSRVVVDDGLISAIEPVDGDGTPDVAILSPGFVDVQVNGIDDVDVARADCADWDRLDRLLLAQGVTTWCPTLVTMRLDGYAAPLDRIAEAMLRPGGLRPTIAGVHLEGPFLGAAPGAHDPTQVTAIDRDWIDALPAHIVLFTLGPEQRGTALAIDALRAQGVVVSVGHSTADDGQLDAAVAHGATLVTHLFNGMSGMHHRSPGVAAWTLTHPTISASIIADGIHVHPRMLRLAFNVLGPDRIVLVTDAVAWRAGSLGPIDITLADNAPRLPDGTLAGSAVTMDAAVRTCVAAGIPLEAALTAASSNPARLLGLHDRATIDIGMRADLVGLSATLDVESAWVAGAAAP